MSFLVDTTFRTEDTEIMDDFSIKGEVLNDALDKLATINRFLGGNKVTIQGLKILLKNHSKEKLITIVDLGCGGGDILKDIAKFGEREGYNLQLVGIDANENAVAYANQTNTEYKNIKFLALDVFSEEFKSLQYDVVITTLFLHHFKELQLLNLLGNLMKTATVGMVINDLHRHKLAYYLFKLITVPVKNKMIIEDGLTSVLRGFKKTELKDMADKLGYRYQLRWKWAFRYQWILFK